MSYTFKNIQDQLAAMTGDTSSEWAAGGAQNKLVVNESVDDILDDILLDTTIRNRLKSQKTLLTVTNRVATLPADFKVLADSRPGMSDSAPSVYLKSCDQYLPIVAQDYSIRDTGSSKTIEFAVDPQGPVYIEYCAEAPALVNDADVPALPSGFHKFVAYYALAKYFHYQRDWANEGNALAIAQGKVKEHIDSTW